MADTRADRYLADYEVPILSGPTDRVRSVAGPTGSQRRPRPGMLVDRAAAALSLLAVTDLPD